MSFVSMKVLADFPVGLTCVLIISLACKIYLDLISRGINYSFLCVRAVGGRRGGGIIWPRMSSACASFTSGLIWRVE